jgi:serine/threonine protein phosphatase 1
MRTLVIGDIHGGLRALHQILERAKVTTKDTLIFLGDYVDGWSQSPQVLDFIIDLNQTKLHLHSWQSRRSIIGMA